ncbi:MAG TPA: hypothetical protein VHD36_09290 [Pirellulales bacterium]|nr:hypothetical protein [Pirellulales bacterium]
MHHRDSSHGVEVASDYRPDFLIRLGIMLPCSEQDVKEAYLAKVKHAHPDAGGNQEDFVALQTDFERALEYSKFHSGRSRWLADSIERYIQQQQVVAELEEHGARVTLEHIEWLKREVGEDFAQVLDTIAGIRLSGPTVNDADIDYLLTQRSMLETLHWLDLSRSKITNQGVLKLAAFANLRKIDLRGTRVGTAVLTLVESLPKLEWIGLTGSGLGWFGRFRLRRRRPELQIG